MSVALLDVMVKLVPALREYDRWPRVPPGVWCVRKIRVMVSLPGHSRGHAGVAIKQGRKWRLYAGDAYFYPAQLELERLMPAILKKLQNQLASVDRKTYAATLQKLRQLIQQHGDEIELFNAHSADELQRYLTRPK